MNLEKILRVTERLIPKGIYNFFQPIYHFTLSTAGAIKNGFPSKKIKIVAVTGTKGKSSTTEIINAILEEAGYTTAVCGTIRFKIGPESKPNLYKMSMPGRFFVQNFIKKAVDAKCDWLIIEMTSEGAKQFRHLFVDLDALVFTNMAPEHIESHGSYENYKNCKLRIAKRLNNGSKKDTKIIVNKDDKEAEDFVKAAHKAKPFYYSLSDAIPHRSENSIQMRFDTATLFSPLQGEFNVYNILGAATFAKSIGVNTETIKTAIEKLKEIPGRAQKITGTTNIENRGKQTFDTYVDYAHTIESLEALYKTFRNKRSICILGNTGGGRDTWKRPKMAETADKYCDHIILTNEDPYDEDPQKILDEMKTGIQNKPYDIILDRREAIKTALSKAEEGNVVLITGKGTDPYIMGANGSKEKWSDYDVVKEELAKFS